MAAKAALKTARTDSAGRILSIVQRWPAWLLSKDGLATTMPSQIPRQLPLPQMATRHPEAGFVEQRWPSLAGKMFSAGTAVSALHRGSGIQPCAVFKASASFHALAGSLKPMQQFSKIYPQPLLMRLISSTSSMKNATEQASRKSGTSQKAVAAQDEDVFDSITDKIPTRPVTAAEGASYSVVILLGLAIAGGAAYFVAKELLLQPKEYQVFNKALDRIRTDSQVVGALGSPITGYGQESRNRAARQRISNKVWTDEDGVERVQVQFHVRGPGGTGLVHCEMFKDSKDRNKMKFTYLIVDVSYPSPRRLMLESFVPT